MKWRLPHLRLAGLALPLLTAGCMSGVMPGAGASDPSCVLLCALTREIAGDPAPQPVVVPAAPKTRAAPKARVATMRPVRKLATRLRPSHTATIVSAKPAKRPKPLVRAHVRPVRRPTHAETSVVPQAPSRVAAPTPVALAPAPPVAAAPPPVAPPRSVSQAIPGSASIMVPNWQAQ